VNYDSVAYYPMPHFHNLVELDNHRKVTHCRNSEETHIDNFIYKVKA